ncbi:hypothetical protein H5410_047622 [Solanum commersonii]|uniref:Uncharacterized protein n=1 Tax=Solanum commersonii TaxID=4109 RepID=A0A9J5XIU1_SOLCO|nr:hypothetical protein H5410_047622 [Solanum commersonii]
MQILNEESYPQNSIFSSTLLNRTLQNERTSEGIILLYDISAVLLPRVSRVSSMSNGKNLCSTLKNPRLICLENNFRSGAEQFCQI